MLLTIDKTTPLAFIAGAALSQVFAPVYAWPLLFLALPVFYHLLHNASSLKSAAWRGFAFGYGYWMAGTWWIANALLVDAAAFGWLFPVSVLGLSALLAVWFGVLGVLFHVGIRRIPYPMPLFVVLWVAVEYLRSLGALGFPWNLLGYSALASLPVAQAASIIGIYGLSALAVLVGMLPYWVWRALAGLPQSRRFLVALVPSALLITAFYAYGDARLAAIPEPDSAAPLIRLVQPNIPQALKGTPEGDIATLKALWEGSLTPLVGEEKIALTVWPETALPETLRGDRVVLRLPPLHHPIVTGAVRLTPDPHLYNSLLAIAPGGTVSAMYDKQQLVPFGEFVPLAGYLPIQKITPGLMPFSRGNAPRVMQVAGVPPFLPLICYEIIFPAMSRIKVEPAPQWILNVTNDGWYGDTAGPYQHLAAAQMRAIETGLPVVRVANSGVSAVIDGRGRMLAQIPLGQVGQLTVRLPLP